MTTRVRIFDSALTRVANGVGSEAVEAALTAGVESAQRLVPVDTGTLRDGIAVQEEPHEVAGGVVGTYGVTTVDYALHVEFGTSVGPEQPYLRPSVDAAILAAKR